jgi:hypothetical protein
MIVDLGVLAKQGSYEFEFKKGFFPNFLTTKPGKIEPVDGRLKLFDVQVKQIRDEGVEVEISPILRVTLFDVTAVTALEGSALFTELH